MGLLTILVAATVLFVTLSWSDERGRNGGRLQADMDPGTIAAPTNMPRAVGQCGNATDNDADQVADDGCDPWDQGGADPLGMGFGTVETCARINENGATDADEESIDTAIINVVADNIRASDAAFAFTLVLTRPGRVSAAWLGHG
jgi:hypothetical protein